MIEPTPVRDVTGHLVQLEALRATTASPEPGPSLLAVARQAAAVVSAIAALPGIDAPATIDEWAAVEAEDQLVITGPNFLLAAEIGTDSATISIMSQAASWSIVPVDETGRPTVTSMGPGPDMSRLGLQLASRAVAGLGVGGLLADMTRGPLRIIATEDGALVGDWTFSATGTTTDNMDIEASNAKLETELQEAIELAVQEIEAEFADVESGIETSASSNSPATTTDDRATLASGDGPLAVGTVGATIGGMAAREAARRIQRRSGKRTEAGEPVESTMAVGQQVCSSCGQALVAGAKFCIRCGTPTTTALPSSAPTGSAGSSAPSRFEPTHRVAGSALVVGGVPSGSYDPATTLDPGLEVRLIEHTPAGWALIECENGWQCYVDAKGLVPMGPASRSTFRFYVEAPVSMQSSAGDRVDELLPDTWYEGLEEQHGWIHAVTADGTQGWVPSSAIRRG